MAATTMTTSIETFINALERLDNAGRARLKRNAGRALSDARDVHRVIFNVIPPEVPERLHEVYFLIATLFPLASNRGGGVSLGQSLRSVRHKRESTSIDRRFQALLDSDREQLVFRLRQAVRLAAATDEPLDWQQLLRDLLRWERDDRQVQLRWARDYFIGQEPLPSVEVL